MTTVGDDSKVSKGRQWIDTAKRLALAAEQLDAEIAALEHEAAASGVPRAITDTEIQARRDALARLLAGVTANPERALEHHQRWCKTRHTGENRDRMITFAVEMCREVLKGNEAKRLHRDLALRALMPAPGSDWRDEIAQADANEGVQDAAQAGIGDGHGYQLGQAMTLVSLVSGIGVETIRKRRQAFKKRSR